MDKTIKPEISVFLRKPNIVTELENASTIEQPPLLRIEPLLVHQFGVDRLREASVRQWTGQEVSRILKERGYTRTGSARFLGEVFAQGGLYERER